MVWYLAANGSPSVQFFYGLEANEPMSLYADLELVPDRQSAILNLINLSRTCHAARAAVLQHFRSIQNPTILRSPCYPGHPFLSLHLDLGSDIICSRTCGVPYEWAEYSHIIFTSARRFALRCQPKRQDHRSLHVTLCEHQDHWVPNCYLKICPRCVRMTAVLLGKFKRLQKLYLLLDVSSEPNLEAEDGDQYWSTKTAQGPSYARNKFPIPELYHSYDGTYEKVLFFQPVPGVNGSGLCCIEDELVGIGDVSVSISGHQY